MISKLCNAEQCLYNHIKVASWRNRQASVSKRNTCLKKLLLPRLASPAGSVKSVRSESSVLLGSVSREREIAYRIYESLLLSRRLFIVVAARFLACCDLIRWKEEMIFKESPEWLPVCLIYCWALSLMTSSSIKCFFPFVFFQASQIVRDSNPIAV